jgi:hypothetical protein
LAEERDDDREKVSENKNKVVIYKALMAYARNMQGPHAPEKIEKPEHLDQHSRDGPFEKDEENSTEEARRPTQLVPPRKKVKRLLRADDEKEAA